MTDKFAPTTFRGGLNGVLRLLAVLGVLAASLLPPPAPPLAPPQSGGGIRGGAGLLPPRAAQASSPDPQAAIAAGALRLCYHAPPRLPAGQSPVVGKS